MADDINNVINQYDVRPGQVYLSGAHIISVSVGPFGVPYWMTGLSVQTAKVALYSSPEPAKKDIQFHKAQQIVSNPVSAFGQAPTSGVYTGVKDECH